MATLQTFHTGRALNLWERCCLQSFGDAGHAVVLTRLQGELERA